MTSLDAGLGRLRTAASQLMAAANALASAGATVVRPVVGRSRSRGTASAAG